MGFVGLATMLGLAFLFSTSRRNIRLKTLAWGISLQFLFALFVLRFSFGRQLLAWAGAAVNKLLGYSFAGAIRGGKGESVRGPRRRSTAHRPSGPA